MSQRTSAWIVASALVAVSGCGHDDQTTAEYPTSPVEQGATKQAPEDVTTVAERDLSGVTPEADAVLRRMSEYLGKLPSFAFDADHSTEVVLDSGQKLAYSASSHVSVRRPNKLRSDRRGEKAELSLFYDGSSITIYGKKANAYAQAPAPPNIDAMIDFARDKLDLDAPAADLLYKNPKSVLTEDAVAGMRVGTAVINGVNCHHMAYRGRLTDWQLWIEDGPRPLPHKYAITTKDVKGSPQYIVEIHHWNINPDLPDTLFTFVPPEGAQRIEFLSLAQEKRKVSGR